MGYISYEKAKKLLEEAGIDSYAIKKTKFISYTSYAAIMSGKSSSPDGGKRGTAINTTTLAVLCKRFHCQPADLLTYIK